MKINTLNDSTVMVAGGAGFIGSALIRELIPLCKRVVVFDNFLFGSIAHLSEVSDNVAIVHGDALDLQELIGAIRQYQVEFIFNCIGDTFVPDAYTNPSRFFDINLTANHHILEAAVQCNLRRVLYVSSTEVYGELPSSTANEETPLAPVNTYAVSKLASDRLCYTHHLEHDTPVVITRIFNSYGPRESHPYVIPEIISQLHRGPVLKLGNILAKRDFTYVHDTAKALIAVMCSEVANGDVVNVGSGRAISIEDMARRLADIMGRGEIEIRLDASRLRKRDIDLFCCDNRKLLALTDWAPVTDLNTGLQATVEWYMRNGGRWCYQANGTQVERVEAFSFRGH